MFLFPFERVWNLTYCEFCQLTRRSPKEVTVYIPIEVYFDLLQKVRWGGHRGHFLMFDHDKHIDSTFVIWRCLQFDLFDL